MGKLNIRNILSVTLAAALLTLFGPAQTVLADEKPVRTDCEEVPQDKEWHDYTLQENEYAYCPIILEENGRLHVSVQTCFDNTHYVYLLDENYETVNYDCVYGAGEASPVVTNFCYDLTPGTYYVRVESWNDCSGLFRIKTYHTASMAPSPDSGESMETAVPYAPTDITGFLSSGTNGESWAESLPEESQNLSDYYLYEADGGTYAILLTTTDPDSRISCEIYDSTYQQVGNAIYSGDKNAAVELDQASYYFRIKSEGGLCGDYHLQIDKQ